MAALFEFLIICFVSGVSGLSLTELAGMVLDRGTPERCHGYLSFTAQENGRLSATSPTPPGALSVVNEQIIIPPIVSAEKSWPANQAAAVALARIWRVHGK